MTGDRIDVLDFQANGAPLGGEVRAGVADVQFDIQGLDTLDTVDVIKNGNIVRRFSSWEEQTERERQFVLRVCYGWGEAAWSGTITLSEGTFRRVVPMFGPPAPDTYRVKDNTVEFSSVTSGYNADWTTNRYRCGGECGFALVIEGDLSTVVDVDPSEVPPGTAEAQAEATRAIARCLLADSLQTSLANTTDEAERALLSRLISRLRMPSPESMEASAN